MLVELFLSLGISSFAGLVDTPNVQKIELEPEAGITLPYNVYFGAGQYFTDFDFEGAKPTTSTTYYVDLDNGNNNNDGLSWETALKTPNSARAKAGSKTIYVAGASRKFNRTESPYGSLGGDTVLIGVDRGYGFPEFSSRFESYNGVSGLQWVADGAAYKTARSAMSNGGVRDSKYKTNGLRKAYTKVNSVAECQATAGSWYTDGTHVWVRPIDDRAIVTGQDEEIDLLYAADGLELTGNYTVYMENIRFSGGKWGFRQLGGTASDRPKFYASRCNFDYALDNNGLDLNGVAEFYLERCTANGCKLDGFNHSARNGYIGGGTEFRCTSIGNGSNGNSNNNGTTIHDGGWVVRFDPVAYDNEGPNLRDIGNGSVSILFKGRFKDSRASNSSQRINIGFGDGSETVGVKGFVYEAALRPGTTTLDLDVGTGSTVYSAIDYASKSGTVVVRPSMLH